MADMARKTPEAPNHRPSPRDDEGSTVRSRDRSSTHRVALGSLDDRIESKVRLASALIRNLPFSDARVRLLHIAIMRRDESLLDGVLAELNRPGSRG